MKIIPVTCALIYEQGKVLCAQRSERMALPLKWELPGGKVEAGESDSECLHREILEELGLEIEILETLEESNYTIDAERGIRLIPFLCRITAGLAEAREHKEIRWVERSRLMELDWANADIPVVQRFMEMDLPGHRYPWMNENSVAG